MFYNKYKKDILIFKVLKCVFYDYVCKHRKCFIIIIDFKVMYFNFFVNLYIS